MDGAEKIFRKTKPVVKAEWMKNAMQKMDSLIDKEIRCKVREECDLLPRSSFR